jgi:tripartite-type tricarboxylate transporter receptor subunit TctC
VIGPSARLIGGYAAGIITNDQLGYEGHQVSRLHAAVDATVRSPDVAAKFTDLGADAQFATPSEFAAYVADDLAKWGRLAKEAGLKVE